MVGGGGFGRGISTGAVIAFLVPIAVLTTIGGGYLSTMSSSPPTTTTPNTAGAGPTGPPRGLTMMSASRVIDREIELGLGETLRVGGGRLGEELHFRYEADASISYSITLGRWVTGRGRCREGKVSLSVEKGTDYEVTLENPPGRNRPNRPIKVTYSIAVDMKLRGDQ